MIQSAAAWAFELLGEEELKQLLAEKDERDLAKDKPHLHCAACGYPITSRKDGTSVNGSHEHTFTNPHGLIFRIGCFGTAPGCIQTGEATDAWTWFPGFEWRLALCHHCQTHLGWGYRSEGGDGFFGLILDRLISPS